MSHPPMKMYREDDQPMTVESAMPLIMATTNEQIPEGPIQQEIPSDEPAQDESIKEGLS